MAIPLILIDRDGTLIHDEKYHLGRTDGWKEKIRFLPGVMDGIRLLRGIPEARIYMITNQPGVTVKGFPLLTKDHADEVCRFILAELETRGAKLDGYFLCAHADGTYVKRHPEFTFEESLVCDCECIKPRLGMVFDALKKEGLDITDTDVYVIGDRATDVETALNVNGTGILIPFEKEPGQEQKVKGKEDVLIATDLSEAASLVEKRHQQ